MSEWELFYHNIDFSFRLFYMKKEDSTKDGGPFVLMDCFYAFWTEACAVMTFVRIIAC